MITYYNNIPNKNTRFWLDENSAFVFKHYCKKVLIGAKLVSAIWLDNKQQRLIYTN